MASTAGWQPQAEPLKQLVQYLNESLSGHDKSAQKNAELMLKQAKNSPDIDNYLCFLLSHPPSPEDVNVTPGSIHAARSAAGIMLKNDIKSHYNSISIASQAYVKSSVLLGLQDENAQIRNYTGNVVTELLRQATILQWPEVLPELLSMASNESGQCTNAAQDGAMAALLKVCEDNKRALGKTYHSQRPLDFIIPKLVNCTASPIAKVRANAIAALNLFIPDKVAPIMDYLDDLLRRIFDLAHDNSEDVRKQICRALVHIAEVAPAKIAPHMDGLVEYMITQQRNVDDPELALDAAEFWLCIGEDKNLRGTLAPFLPKIVPVLLESMVYSEDDVLRLESEAEDAEIDDREQDIKPQFAVSKSIRANASSNGDVNGSDGANNNNQSGDDELSEGELEEYGEEDEDENDPEEQWNLRKCSAAALDVFASVFNQPVFETTLPYLRSNLTHTDWPNREAAVLTIGAIADGCMNAVQPNLPELIPFLISLLSDPMPVVRQITCWSLGRYSAWAAHLDEVGKAQFFLPMMDGMLKRMLDPNKRVQEAAASAFASLEEKAGAQLKRSEYCEVIVRQFAECFAKYKDRNMFILYDCVETLAEHVGSTLAEPQLVQYLMPALLKRWDKVSDESREIFPLFECLSYVATALGNSFLPYAGPVFARCNRIIVQNLQEGLAAAGDEAVEEPDKDFLVTSLDLMSASIQSLEDEQAIQVVKESQPNMFDLLAFCLEDINTDVRQSAYALLGDTAIFVFPELRASLERILPILIAQLDLTASLLDADEVGHPVKNNACWSCGEIAVRAREAMAPYVETLLQRFYAILTSQEVPKSLRENAAIALGRLGSGCGNLLGPHLPNFGPLYLQTIAGIEWTDEKAQSMGGFSEVVLVNPQGLEQCLNNYLVEIARGTADSTNSLMAEGSPYNLFQQTLSLYKSIMPNFDSFLQHLPQGTEQILRHTYKV